MIETSNLTDVKDSLQKALHQVILVRFLQTFTRSQNNNSYCVLLIWSVLVGATVTLIVTGAESLLKTAARAMCRLLYSRGTGLTFTALLSPLQSVTFSSSSSSICILLFHFPTCAFIFSFPLVIHTQWAVKDEKRPTSSLTNGSRLRWSLSVRVRADGDLMIQQQELKVIFLCRTSTIFQTKAVLLFFFEQRYFLLGTFFFWLHCQDIYV